MNINISSTSYLLPEARTWLELKKDFNITYSNFGNIFNEKENSSIEVKVIFLKDIVDNNILNKNYKQNKNKVLNLLKTLNNNNNNIKKYIICVSAFDYFNPIMEARKENLFNKLKNDFLKEIYNIILKKNNFYILDIDKIFSQYGYNKCLDERNFVFSRCRFSNLGLEKYISNLNLIINRIIKPSKKVLILDCDNTLWGGVLGEDGIENILIGQDGIGMAYQEFQKAILEIKNRGILLVLSSKNNTEDVVKVLNKHDEMIIKEKHIASLKVNWKEKYQNILKLSKDLFLSTNSFVFWDDNPIERKKVKMKIKDVEVIEPKNDISEWAKQLLELPSLSKIVITNDDLKKTTQYKYREEFLTKKNNSKDEINYLKSINLKPSFVKLNASNILRAEQMCMKTNQFNLNTKRLTTSELKQFNKKKKILLIHLKDKYGDHGIISLLILNETKNAIIIELFLMSCRIIGRYLENWILEKVRLFAKNKKKKYVLAEFKKSQRNEIAMNFLKENNFSKLTKKQMVECFQKLKINKNLNYVGIKSTDKIKNIEIYEKIKQSIN